MYDTAVQCGGRVSSTVALRAVVRAVLSGGPVPEVQRNRRGLHFLRV